MQGEIANLIIWYMVQYCIDLWPIIDYSMHTQWSRFLLYTMRFGICASMFANSQLMHSGSTLYTLFPYTKRHAPDLALMQLHVHVRIYLYAVYY